MITKVKIAPWVTPLEKILTDASYTSIQSWTRLKKYRLWYTPHANNVIIRTPQRITTPCPILPQGRWSELGRRNWKGNDGPVLSLSARCCREHSTYTALGQPLSLWGRNRLLYWLTHVLLFATPWAVAHQAPLFMGFSRQEYSNECRFLLQGIFPTQGSNLCLLHLLHLQTDSLATWEFQATL